MFVTSSTAIKPMGHRISRRIAATLTERRALLWGFRRGLTPTLLALAMLLGVGCARSSSELREWQPSDHRVPSGIDESEATQNAATPEPGEALYLTHCASCHGPAGRGDGPEAPPMARVPSFADPRVAALDDEAIASAIVEGRGGFMPGFAGRISEAGVRAIVRHVRALSSAR